MNQLKKMNNVTMFMMGPDKISKADCRSMQEQLQGLRTWDNLHIG